MKKSTPYSFRFLPVAICLLSLIAAQCARAATSYYLDVNGATTGSGVTAGGTYSWEDPIWGTSATGTAATGNWGEGGFPRFAAGSDATGSYTVTANADHHIAGMLHNSFAATVTINGTGVLTIDPPQQGFFGGSGGFIRINNKLSGTGGVVAQSGQIYLDGNNDYSGDTTAGAGLINFNNANSFGTGNLLISVSGSALIPEGASAITIPNNWNVTVNASLNCVGLAAGITYAGNVNLNANTLTLGCGGGAGALDIFSGVISGSGGIGRQSSGSHGTIRLTGANTYTGKTSLQSSVTDVSSINSVTTPAPQASSNLGKPASVASGTLGFGAASFTGTLRYTGAGETTDRVIDLAGTTGGGTIQNDGSGALVFTSDCTASGVGVKTLTLQGSNTGNNTIAGKIVDSSGGATSVTKDQAGTWVLLGANTYSGDTTVSAGTLQISGSIAAGAVIGGGTLEVTSTGLIGNVTNNAGVLTLDSAAALKPTASVSLLSSLPAGSVNLNFSGTQPINALYLDFVAQAQGTWGAPGSGAANESPIFTGSGRLNVVGAPVIVQQPQSVSAYPDGMATFSVQVTGDPSFTYQWKRNGSIVPGANFSDYTINPVEAANAGTYVCWITNNYGWTNTSPAVLTVLETNSYVNIVRGDFPISYWRLDETNGTFANDWVGGNLGQYHNVLLNQPGYSLTDSDPGIGLPAGTGRGYVEVTNYTPFTFLGAPAFSLEGWAYFTNLTGVQRIFSTFRLTAPNGWAFGINGANGLRFTTGTVQDADQSLGTPLVTGLWYHLVCTCDGSAYHFYVNGQEMGTGVPVTGGNNGVAAPLTLGCNPVAYTNNTTGDPLGEQVKGRLDELAVYGYTLSPLQVTNHYAARYGTLQAPIVSTPVANPPTNYATLSASIQAVAAGQALSYQWYKAPSTLLPDKTDETLTLSPLQLSDAGSYYVHVTNPAGNSNSPSVALTVLSIPTSASDLNLTNSLVVHLPFDSDYLDISGRGNNGTNVGATTLITPAAVGGKALHYSSDAGSSTYNYVTMGVRPDLQFGASTDFTVAYWVRQPMGSTYTNLPFFTDAIGSTGNGGFAFAPYQTATTAGGWILTIGTMSSPSVFTSFPDADLINDGNWHQLVHCATRTANVVTYLDGAQVDSQAIGFLGDINTPNAATIGQDPTGTYPVTADADLDDLAVWQRALTPLEVSGMYLAGSVNHVSFAPPVVAVPGGTIITDLSGTTLSYTGGSGSKFVLVGTNNVAAPLANWPRLQTNSTTPGSFTIPAVGTGAPMYYRIKIE